MITNQLATIGYEPILDYFFLSLYVESTYYFTIKFVFMFCG